MKRLILLIITACISVIQYGQIIADHTVVDKYDDIPPEYIERVKEMWIVVAGESHSAAYRTGTLLLEAANPTYSVNVKESGTPDPYTNQNLRISRATWGDYEKETGWIYSYGEEDWFTNPTAVSRTKAGISYCNNNNLVISAIGFGWCWDMVNGGPTANIDPVYGCRWYGVSLNGPNGDLPWGLDSPDNTMTGNTINMDTYLTVTQQYIDFCNSSGYPTKVFFTTGPVDSYYNVGEAGYQGHIKHEYIRNYVKANPSRILFDYADILCYNDDGTLNTSTWNGHTFPIIASSNLTPTTTGHISNSGAIRLAKALWWMLARIAGWDGGVTEVDDTLPDDEDVLTELRGDELVVYLPENKVYDKVEIYSISGSLMASKRSNSDFISFNVSGMNPGIYFLVFYNTSGFMTKQIMLP